MRAHEYDGHLGRVAVVRHLGVVAVDGIEGNLVLQTEHKDDGIHPQ